MAMSKKYRRPVHVSVFFKVKKECEETFVEALKAFIAKTLEETSTLGAQFFVLPEQSSKEHIDYALIRTFETPKDSHDFFESKLFHDWREEAKPWIDEIDEVDNLKGLEALLLEGGKEGDPPLWKVTVVTWIGVWLAVWLENITIFHWFADLPTFIMEGVVTLPVVVFLGYFLLPWLNQLFSFWLYPDKD